MSKNIPAPAFWKFADIHPNFHFLLSFSSTLISHPTLLTHHHRHHHQYHYPHAGEPSLPYIHPLLARLCQEKVPSPHL